MNATANYRVRNGLATLAGLSAVFLIWISCSNSAQNAKFQLQLTDSPGDYQEVNIDIQSVEVNNETGNNGWRSMKVEKGIYNLQDLVNGKDTLLAITDLPAGKISQIRLVLGPNNTIKTGGAFKPLSTPSAQQSGLKLNVHAELKEGITYVMLLDFDAAKSIVEHGDGTYSLKPVIHVISEETSGSIKGTVAPALSSPAVFAIVGSDTLATSFADDNGKFLLRGLPAGTYLVSISPKTGYQAQQKENVSVTIGTVTDLGTIIIN